MLIGAIVGALIGLVLAMVIDARERKQPQVAPSQPEPVARGTWWEPASYQLHGTLEQAANVVDPNMPVGELVATWLDYHQREGDIIVVQPDPQVGSTQFQPPAVRRQS